MPQTFVTVHACDDPIEGQIVGDLLVDEGFDARVVGGRAGGGGGIFGAGAPVVDCRVDVPAGQADAARRTVAAHLSEIRPEVVAEEEPDEPAARPALSGLFAAGAVLVCPGAGHFYARRHALGLAILAGQMTALAVIATSGTRAGAIAAVFACGLFIADLVGGQLAVRAFNRGERKTRVRQLATAALLFVGVGAIAAVAGPLLERLHLPVHRGSARTATHEEIRQGMGDPRFLPFPLHLDFRR